jgi:uncharacterized protein YjbI with pentapeptide repeats
MSLGPDGTGTIGTSQKYNIRPGEDLSNNRALVNRDLRGANLSYANLSGSLLSGSDLSGANLRCAKLHNAELEGVNLSGADLTGAIFNDADLSGANLVGANGACGDHGPIRLRTIFRSADLSGADLTDSIFNGADFNKANLRGAILENADLSDAFLLDARLIDADLTDANLKNAHLVNTKLTRANMERANLDGTNIPGAIFDGAILIGASMSRFKVASSSYDTVSRSWVVSKCPPSPKMTISMRGVDMREFADYSVDHFLSASSKTTMINTIFNRQDHYGLEDFIKANPLTLFLSEVGLDLSFIIAAASDGYAEYLNSELDKLEDRIIALTGCKKGNKPSATIKRALDYRPEMADEIFDEVDRTVDECLSRRDMRLL